VIKRIVSFDVPARVLAALLAGLVLLGVLIVGAAARERADLPHAAHGLLRATIAASTLTSCLEGVQDDRHLNSKPDLSRVGAQRALTRLQTCDVSALERDLAAIHLPPAPPLIDKRRRTARAEVQTGLSLLRQAALDARGAVRAMREDITVHPSGLAVVLAFRSTNDASNRAFVLAYNALDLLHQKRTLTG
jgi:hypothetical protein